MRHNCRNFARPQLDREALHHSATSLPTTGVSIDVPEAGIQSIGIENPILMKAEYTVREFAGQEVAEKQHKNAKLEQRRERRSDCQAQRRRLTDVFWLIRGVQVANQVSKRRPGDCGQAILLITARGGNQVPLSAISTVSDLDTTTAGHGRILKAGSCACVSPRTSPSPCPSPW